MLPQIVQCPVATLNLLQQDAENYAAVRKEHFEDNRCITCMDMNRDALPWSELFKEKRI